MATSGATFPNGFNHGVSIRGVPILNLHSKKVLWVDSNGATNGDGSFNRPYLTVDTAIDASVAGGIIFIKEGHAETLTTANVVTQDVAGLCIKGLGVGNRRPTFTFTPTGVTDTSWTVSGASCSVENIIGVAGLDAITKPFSVTGAAPYIDIEWQDASSAIEAETVILTGTSADNLYINMKYLGFTAGNACVAPIKLNGCTGGRVNIDFYGIASTAVVNFVTTLCTNIDVRGYGYVSGTTDGSKLVVDTIGSSIWYAEIYDGAAAAVMSGGSGTSGTLASDDISVIAATTGAVATAAATGAVTATDSLMAYIKQLVTMTGLEADTDPVSMVLSGTGGITTWKSAAIPATGVSISELLAQVYAALEGTAAGMNGVATWPTAAAYASNVSIAEVLGYIQDAVRNGSGTAMATNKSVADALGFNGSAFVAGGLGMYLPRCVEKSDGAVLAGNDNLFTITGGPVRAKIVGLVTTVIGGASNGDLQLVSTDPAATVDLNAAPVAVTSDVAGTFYSNRGATSVFTPSAGLAFQIGDPVTVEEVEFLLAPGTVHFRSSGAQTGVIKWYMTYWPLSPLSTVVAAA